MLVLYLDNGSFIFFSNRLEILVPGMMFDICTAYSPVCLCLIALGLVFMNGKILHHRSQESRINCGCIIHDISKSDMHYNITIFMTL